MYLQSITWNTYSKSQLLGIHISFTMFQAMDDKIGKLIVAHQFWVDWRSKLYNRKWLKYCVMILLVARRRVIIMISTEADNDKRLTWVLKSMRISFDHFIYCIVLYKCETIFSFCCSIFSILWTVLGNVFKSSLITSVTTVHGLGNQKWI